MDGASDERVRETYQAAIQHDLVDLSEDERLVGVVRRPAPWFLSSVEENHRALGPPDALLDEFQETVEDLKGRGMCETGAHNAAWEELDLEARYREYLDSSAEARAALADLQARIEAGESLVLVCYEADDKRCHRRVLAAVLEDRLAGE